MIGAGDYPHQIRIQHRTGGVNEWEEPIPAGWADLTARPIWARVTHQSGHEAIKAGVDTSTVRANVRIRWRAGVDAGMRVVYAGKFYDIEAVLPGSTRQHLDLTCKLVQGASDG